MTDTKYNSVSELLQDISDDPNLADDVKKASASRELIKHLISHRVKAEMSQKQLSEKMDCTQSRISKLEQSNDAEIRLGDIEDYLGAMGLQIRVSIAPKSFKAVDEIKYCANRIRDLLTRLVKLANEDDPNLSDGIARFACFEVPMNTLKFIFEAVKHLPKDVLSRVTSSTETENCLICDSAEFDVDREPLLADVDCSETV